MFGMKGDEGTSIDPSDKGRRILKNTPIIKLLGELDELMAVIGIANAYIEDPDKGIINKIQKSLIDISFFISTYHNKSRETYDPTYNLENTIKMIENYISNIEPNNAKKGLHLIITYGGKCSSHLYHARAVCRRLERVFLKFIIRLEGPLFMTKQYIPTILAFLNRLGDYLFFTSKEMSDENEIYYL